MRTIREQMEDLAYQIVRDGFAEKYEFETFKGRAIKLWLTILVDAPAPKAFPATQLKHIDFPVTLSGLQELKEWYRDAKAAWEALVELAQTAEES